MARKVYTTRYTVEGAYPFPFDMLRYDMAWPVDGTDLSDTRDYNPYKVNLQSLGLGVDSRRRWESFGWRVVDEQEPVQFNS